MANLQQGEIRWDNLAHTDDKEDIEKYFSKKLSASSSTFLKKSAKELVDLINQIDAMKKNILGKAFRGSWGQM